MSITVFLLALAGLQGSDLDLDQFVTELLSAADAPAAEVTRRESPSGVVSELSFRGDSSSLGLPPGFRTVFQDGLVRTKELADRWVLFFEGAESREAARLELVRGPGGVHSYTGTWTRPRSPGFVDVTADLLALEPETARALSLGVDELREALDPRVGLPLVGHVAGLAAGDLDDDGRTDLYVCAPGGVANRVLVHGEGNRARDASAELGLDVLDASRSAMIADISGDGKNDLWLTLGDELIGFERAPSGRYEVAVRLPGDATTSMAAADVDLDGQLDTYVCGYANPYEGGSVPLPYHDAENGVANDLWRGLGAWGFERAGKRFGLDVNNARFSFAAAFVDFDEDGDPDLYVANDFGRNNLFENQSGRGFLDVAEVYGVEDVAAGMGVTFGDLDLDGDEDLYVANMFSAAGNRVSGAEGFRETDDESTRSLYRRHAKGNSFFERREADGVVSFHEKSRELGIDVGWWSWGVRALDADTNGALDLAVPAGMITRSDPDDL